MASTGILNSNEFNYLINREVPQNIFITKIDSSDIIDLVENGFFLSIRTNTFKTIQKIIKSNFDDSIHVVALSIPHLPL